jgi:hypothetical protein
MSRLDQLPHCPCLSRDRDRSALSSSSRCSWHSHTALLGQIRQLETVTGITLLSTGRDGLIILTAEGGQFAGDVFPVLESLAQSRRRKSASHAP